MYSLGCLVRQVVSCDKLPPFSDNLLNSSSFPLNAHSLLLKASAVSLHLQINLFVVVNKVPTVGLVKPFAFQFSFNIIRCEFIRRRVSFHMGQIGIIQIPLKPCRNLVPPVVENVVHCCCSGFFTQKIFLFLCIFFILIFCPLNYSSSSSSSFGEQS